MTSWPRLAHFRWLDQPVLDIAALHELKGEGAGQGHVLLKPALPGQAPRQLHRIGGRASDHVGRNGKTKQPRRGQGNAHGTRLDAILRLAAIVDSPRR